jgi:hypothetical protein
MRTAQLRLRSCAEQAPRLVPRVPCRLGSARRRGRRAAEQPRGRGLRLRERSWIQRDAHLRNRRSHPSEATGDRLNEARRLIEVKGELSALLGRLADSRAQETREQTKSRSVDRRRDRRALTGARCEGCVPGGGTATFVPLPAAISDVDPEADGVAQVPVSAEGAVGRAADRARCAPTRCGSSIRRLRRCTPVCWTRAARRFRRATCRG